MDDSCWQWSLGEFGHAQLGDERRTKRLVALAARAAGRPGGTIARVFDDLAEREAAFRFVESESIEPREIVAASSTACARRCRDESLVVVGVDATGLSYRDPGRRRGLGPLGKHKCKTAGIHVMSALAVSASGESIGLLDQRHWVRSWARPSKSKSGGKWDRRKRSDRETYFWVRVLKASQARLSVEAPACRPWFQLDRGGDCQAVLEHAHRAQLLVTIRANFDRRLTARGQRQYLFAELAKRPPDGYDVIEIPEREGRPRRTATLAIRRSRVSLSLPVRHQRHPLEINVVSADEVGAPAGVEPVRWVLLTTASVKDFEAACQVVRAYSLRWRIEDFHRAWKSGACCIEDSQLRHRSHLLRWAAIMAPVAARIERLKHLSRAHPEQPATVLFSQVEIDAVLLLRRSRGRKVPYEPGQVPTLGELTRWIADLGGYMGSKNSKPPGTVVLQRGLERVATAAQLLAELKEGGT
jgi:Transposase DNA-binding/Transposase Tn5 dimerisation domain